MLFLSYDPNNVYLSFSSNISNIAITPNQKNVAAQIDSITDPTADETAIISGIVSLSPDQAREALDDIAGEQYTGLIGVSEHADKRFIRRIFNSFRDLLDPCRKCCYCGVNEFWMSVEGGRATAHGDLNAKGFKSQNVDISAGMHAYVTPAFLLGGAVDYEADRLSFSQGGHNTLLTFQGAAYGVYRKPYTYVLAEVVLGGSWSNFKRPIVFDSIFRTAASRPKIVHGRAYAEWGFNLPLCHFLIQPFVGGDAGFYSQRGIKEHDAGALNLDIHRNSTTVLNSYLGSHFSFDFLKCFALRADIAWQHFFGPHGIRERTRFIEFGSPFTIRGTRQGSDGILGSVYLSAQVSKTVEAYFEVSGEKWKKWSDLSGTFGMGWWW